MYCKMSVYSSIIVQVSSRPNNYNLARAHVVPQSLLLSWHMLASSICIIHHKSSEPLRVVKAKTKIMLVMTLIPAQDLSSAPREERLWRKGEH